MIYEISHVTRYQYGASVEMTTGVLRLTPRSDDGQTLERIAIETRPPARSMAEQPDSFANRVTRFRIDTPHRELIVAARSRVRVVRPPPPRLDRGWEDVAREALRSRSLGADGPALGLFPSRMVSLFDEATAYARTSFSPRRPIGEAAQELNARITADFAYDPRSTEVTTAPAEAFAQRRGVCQDFAHVMIAALRGLGLPALYVSGYIRTLPPPGQPRLVGADASHAWVALWCGASDGWRGYDPTNAALAGDDHVVLARGRDYSDVSPMEGVILSSGGHRLDVSVDVAPVGE